VLDHYDRALAGKRIENDVDANPATTLAYGVLAMPTLALYVRGEIVARIVGARPRTAILRELEPHLAVAARG